MSDVSVAYMFHAIGDVMPGDIADKHYAFSENKFRDFLAVVGCVSSIRDALQNPSHAKALCTFDDGHISNYAAALYMKEHGYGSADFFVNPSTVGQKNFMDWAQLKEISAAGMSIQSHAYEHVYLSDLTENEQYEQLYRSKSAIEEKLGSEVTIIAPPGGRFNAATKIAAQRAGYKTLAGSVPGSWSGETAYVRRIPVMQGNTVEQLASCLKSLSPHRFRLQAKYYSTYTVKKMLGNGVYDALRKKVLG